MRQILIRKWFMGVSQWQLKRSRQIYPTNFDYVRKLFFLHSWWYNQDWFILQLKLPKS